MSLFRRDLDFTTLFHTREDKRTNLFFRPDETVNVLDSTIDATMTINGYNVTISGLSYQYVETDRTNAENAILYFAKGIFTNPIDIVQNGVAYGTLPPQLTTPFTNPDPVPNPIESSVTQTHNELFNQTFSACLWKQSNNTTSILYSVQKDLTVDGAFTDATLSVKSFDNSTNQVTLQLKVDTTYDYFWYDIQNSTALFDWDTNKFSDLLFQQTSGLYTYTENANAGGSTAPYDQRYSISFTDTAPYFSGNFVIWEWKHQVVEYDFLRNFVGNGVFSLTNSGAFSYASAKPMIIIDAVVPWIGINSFSVGDTNATIVKSYVGWTNDYLFKHTHGGSTTTYVITGGETIIDFVALGITANNNDVFEIVQPISGPNISVIYQKDITVAYTGTPPDDWTVTVTITGFNLPVIIDIEDVSNNKLDHLEITQSPQTFDIRTLPLETDPHGHTHVDWYGFGTVYFKHGTVVTPFDASYVTEADGDRLSGAEIQGFDVAITNDPYTYTYSDTGKLYEGDSYTAFNRFGNDYTYTDMHNITRTRHMYDESFQHAYNPTYPIQKISTNSTGTEVYWSFNFLNQAVLATGTLAIADRLDTMGLVTYTNATNSSTNIMSIFAWDDTQTNGYWVGYNSSTFKNVIEKWTGGSLVSTWTLTTNFGSSTTITDIVVSGTDMLVLQVNGTINKYDITTFPPNNTPTQTDTTLGIDSDIPYPNKECVSLQLIDGLIVLSTIIVAQSPPYSINDNFYNSATITGTDLTTLAGFYETPHDNLPFRSLWLRTLNGSSYVAKEDYIYYEADSGSRHNVLSKTFNINQPEQFQSPSNYTVETNIPFLHPLFFAHLVDTTPDYGTPQYTYSEQVTIGKSFDVGDTFLSASVVAVSFLTGYVSVTIGVNTAQNNVWRRLSKTTVKADYNSSKMTLSHFIGANGYEDTSVVYPSTSPFENELLVLHSVAGIAGGDFQIGNIFFEFTKNVTQADINQLVLHNLFDSTLIWKTDKVITPKDFNITWQGIMFVNDFTTGSFTVTKTVTNAFDFTYSINGGTSVAVTGAFGLTQVVSASLFNDDVIEVFQPYFGNSVTVTVFGLSDIPAPVQSLIYESGTWFDAGLSHIYSATLSANPTYNPNGNRYVYYLSSDPTNTAYFYSYNYESGEYEDVGTSHPNTITRTGDQIVLSSPGYPNIGTFTDPYYTPRDPYPPEDGTSTFTEITTLKYRVDVSGSVNTLANGSYFVEGPAPFRVDRSIDNLIDDTSASPGFYHHNGSNTIEFLLELPNSIVTKAFRIWGHTGTTVYNPTKITLYGSSTNVLADATGSNLTELVVESGMSIPIPNFVEVSFQNTTSFQYYKVVAVSGTSGVTIDEFKLYGI